MRANRDPAQRSTIAGTDEARWREARDLNVLGDVNRTCRFYGLMTGRKAGVIINIIGSARESVQPTYLAGSAGNLAEGVHSRDGRYRAARRAVSRYQPRPGRDEPDDDAIAPPKRRRSSALARGGASSTGLMPSAVPPRPVRSPADSFGASDKPAVTSMVVTVDGGGTGRRGML
jgi:hypothetical protein